MIAAADTTPPVVHVDAARTQHVLQQKNLLVAVTSSEDAKVRITARIDVTRTTRSRLSTALANGHRVTPHVTVSVRDAARNDSLKRFTIRCVG